MSVLNWFRKLCVERGVDRLERAVDAACVEMARLRAENAKLRSALQSLASWGGGSTCNDCTPFRSCPAALEWHHERGCDHLKDINLAYDLLGHPEWKDEGHDFEDPEAEMRRIREGVSPTQGTEPKGDE